jgi:hypothetical protein
MSSSTSKSECPKSTAGCNSRGEVVKIGLGTIRADVDVAVSERQRVELTFRSTPRNRVKVSLLLDALTAICDPRGAAHAVCGAERRGR